MTIAGVTLNPSELGVVSLLFTMFGLLVTDVLVTGKRLRKAEARAERLEEKVWTLMETASVAVTAAEVASEVISHLPDPATYLVDSEGE
jgi:hypothetical protein